MPVDGLTLLGLPTHLQRPSPIELIHDIGGVQKKVSQNLAVLAIGSYNSYKALEL